MKKVLLLLVSFSLFFISGCTQVTQLNEKLIVQSIGVDLEEEKYVVTVQALDIENVPGKENEVGKKVNLFKAYGYSVQDAMTNIKIQSGKDPLYSQTLVLVIGKKAAERGVSNFINFFIRYYDFSPSIQIIISCGSAYGILSTKIDDKLINAETLVSILEKGCDTSGRLNSNIGSFIGDLKSQYISAIACYAVTEENDNKTKLMVNQIAFFDEDKLRDYLNIEETKGYLFIKGKAINVTDVVNSKDYSDVSYAVTKSKTKHYITLDKGKLNVTVSVNADININESSAFMGKKKDFSDLELLVQQRIEKLVRMAINKAIIENKCDAFGFIREFVKKDLKAIKEIEDPMVTLLKDANYNVDVKAYVTSVK